MVACRLLQRNNNNNNKEVIVFSVSETIKRKSKIRKANEKYINRNLVKSLKKKDFKNTEEKKNNVLQRI